MAKGTPTWTPDIQMLKAIELAFIKHGDDSRKIRQEPYIGHLFGVASLVIEYGGTKEQATAAFLHDLLEDVPMKPETLAEQFGKEITDMVMGCTDATYEQKLEEKAIMDPEKRKAAFRARKQGYIDSLRKKTIDDPSVLVALADKVNNGEKSARDLKEDPELFKNFNADIDTQRWWYTELVKAFNTNNKFTEHQKVLLKRFEAAVESMFPATTK